MPTVTARKFASLEEVNLFLKGAIIFTPKVTGAARVYGLVGKKITFLAPADAVTFTTSSVTPNEDVSALTMNDIRTQIMAQVAGVTVKQLTNGRWAIVESTPSGGIHVDSNTSNTDAVALAALGLADNAVGTVYAAMDGETAPTDPYFLQACCDANGAHIVYTME